LSLPLLFEFIVDAILTIIYPVYKTSITEHRTGQLLLILSLTLPIILVKIDEFEHVSLRTARSLLSFCHGLAVCAIYGQLQVFNPAVWKWWKVMAVFASYVLSQLMYVLGQGKCDLENEFNPNCKASKLYVGLALMFSILCCVTHLYISRDYWITKSTTPKQLNKQKVSENNNNNNKNHLCRVMDAIITSYLAIRIVTFTLNLSAKHSDKFEFRGKIVLLIILVVVTAIVPGRIVRGKLQTTKVCCCIFFLYLCFKCFYNPLGRDGDQ
jgi:hypothetical protein